MIALVVAYAKNRAIGKDGRIPWNIDGEKTRFKNLTVNHVVIMGRKTYEEIGRPLPNRTTIVISKTKDFTAPNCQTAKSLQEAIALAGDEDIYISGGAGIYEESLPFVEKMYITEIDAVIEGDTFFPEFEEDLFVKEIERRVDGDIPYTFLTYTRKS